MIALRGTKDTKVYAQVIIEGSLQEVELGYKVVVLLRLDNGVMVHETNRCTVVRCICASTEGYMMILDETRASDGRRKIGVKAAIIIRQAQSRSRRDIALAGEHVQVLIDTLEAHIAIIGDMELLGAALLCDHLDDATGTTASVLGRFGCVIQYVEALDIGRVDSRKRGQVAGDSINNNQGVVAPRKGGGASHAYGVEHGHPILAA